MGTLHHVIQRNIIVGHRNLLRVAISLICSADEDLIENIITQLEDKDEEALDRLCEAHGQSLRMAPATVRRHIDKLIDGSYADVVWPDLPDLSKKES